MDEPRIPWPEWKTIRKIGKGGYGTVYEISRTDISGMEERAAMKVIRFPQEETENRALYAEGYDKDSITAYNRERLDKVINEYAMMMQMKGHRNIVRCDACEAISHEDGMGWDVFIRMELLTSLHTKLEKGNLSEAEIIKLGKDLCQALVLCEKKNIVHRDIKPENILVNEYGDYKLGDFGIARTMERTTNATRTGSTRFMAPEIYKGKKYGSTVDIYSLGMVMYWLLNNERLPFLPLDRPPTLTESDDALKRRMAGDEVLPAPVNGSEELRHIVLKACSYDASDRYLTAEDFYNELLAAETKNAVKKEKKSDMGKNDFEYDDNETLGIIPDHKVKQKKDINDDNSQENTENEFGKVVRIRLGEMGIGWKTLIVWAVICAASLLWMLGPIVYGEVSFSVLEIVLSLSLLILCLVLFNRTNHGFGACLLIVEMLIFNYQLGWGLITIANFYGHYTLLVILSMLAWIVGTIIVLLSCTKICSTKKIVEKRDSKNSSIARFAVSVLFMVLAHVLSIIMLFYSSDEWTTFAPQWLCIVLLIIVDGLYFIDKEGKLHIEAVLLSFVVGILLMIVSGRVMFAGDAAIGQQLEPVWNHILMPNLAIATAYSMDFGLGQLVHRNG